MAKYPLAIKISNLLVYVFLFGGNLLSFFGSDYKNSPYNGTHPTYISFAPFVFGVWGLIHFLLGGFVIYQFFASDRAEELIVDGVNWHFVCIGLLNSLWIYLWQKDYLILAWITILLTSVQVSAIYRILSQSHGEGSCSISERIWTHAPFSLYHAWIFVIAVISTFAAFAPDKVDDKKPSVLMRILVIIGLLVLESTAVAYVEALKGDVAGALVIDWALYGIAVEQEDPFIHWTALILAGITSIHILIPIYKKYIRRSNEETAPLLG